jgi:hypothetical protein
LSASSSIVIVVTPGSAAASARLDGYDGAHPMVYGGGVLHGFAFAMLVGIGGTYSTIFIAAAIAILLSNRSEGRASRAVSHPAR